MNIIETYINTRGIKEGDLVKLKYDPSFKNSDEIIFTCSEKFVKKCEDITFIVVAYCKSMDNPFVDNDVVEISAIGEDMDSYIYSSFLRNVNSEY